MLFGLYDVLISVGVVYPDMTNRQVGEPLLDIQIVAADAQPFRCFGNILIEPHAAIGSLDRVDAAVVCDMYTPIDTAPRGRYGPEIEDAAGIDDVAYQVGYEDPAFFRRLFKREVGLTPAGTAQVQIRPDVALPAERAGATGARGDVRIGPLRDTRRDSAGTLIGERTTLGNISLGMIEMQPPPAEALGQVVRAELAAFGFSTTTSESAASVSGQVTKFAVTTPATALHWDINGVVELELVARGGDGRQHDGRYTANCTDRTFVFPSNDLIGGVVTACLKEIGAKLRKDTALAGVLVAPQILRPMQDSP